MRLATFFALALTLSPAAFGAYRTPGYDRSKGDSERIVITIDYSRCTGGGYRYDQIIKGVDDRSTQEIEGHVRKHASTTADEYYFKETVDIPANGWNGRLVLTDTPENKSRTNLFGIRIMTDLVNGFDMWPEANPDEETGEERQFIAPLTYYYWSTTPTKDRPRGDSDKNRGFAFNRHVADNPKGKITGYIQWC